MKRTLLFLILWLPILTIAQEVEQSIPADSYQREGGTMIITFYVPKSDVPVNLQYDVKDVFFVANGQAYRAQSVTGEMRYLTPGKHTIYWEIGKDASDLYSVQEISVVIRFTQETYNKVQEWKRMQEQQEQNRILQEVRAQERKRVEDSIRRANQHKKKYAEKKEKKKERKNKHRYFKKKQIGLIGSLGSSYAFDDPNNTSNKWDNEALSWRVGLMYRTHLWSWFGLESGAIYSYQKFSYENLSTKKDEYDSYASIQIPIKGHLYFGKRLNLIWGYMYKYRINGFKYSDSDNKENMLDEAKLANPDAKNKDIFNLWGGGWVYGAEWRSPNTVFSVTFQKDNRDVKPDSDRRHSVWWFTYGIYF